jgi:spore coat protein A
MAERVEVIVDFSGHSIGTRFFLTDLRRAGAEARIMRFDVVRAARDDSAIPERLGSVTPILRDAASRMRALVFTRGPSKDGEVRWSINGEEFDPGHPIATVRRGDVEIWRIANHTFRESHNIVHPVHLHLVNFQILERNGKPPLAHETGWKDTVALEPGEEVQIIMKFEPYQGKYVLHCHNLEHEDRGMMARFDVV